jgi:SAM-dependent methyltransferase
MDVGCGSGSLLRSLSEIGFSRLVGVDPFVPADLTSGGVTVLKASLAEVEPAWDLIMLHHSYEHMTDPVEVMTEIARLLAPGGVCLVRIPLVPNQAWTTYGVNWVGLDPPRHIFLHSVKSLRSLAAGANLEVTRVLYDSTFFQFWASELYARDVPLVAADASHIDVRRIIGYESMASSLNASGAGDQAAFYLAHPGT